MSENSLDAFKSYERYCSLRNLSVDDQQFCYNTDSVKNELLRLLDLGADENRVCKKVYQINPDFCRTLKLEKEAKKSTNKKSKNWDVIYD